jgi:hypothetical protein
MQIYITMYDGQKLSLATCTPTAGLKYPTPPRLRTSRCDSTGASHQNAKDGRQGVPATPVAPPTIDSPSPATHNTARPAKTYLPAGQWWHRPGKSPTP